VSLRALGCWELPALFDAWRQEGVAAARARMGAVEATGGAGDPAPLVYASGFQVSRYADIRPSGGDSRSAPRRLWHASPGSSGG
jgi:error-prone DNA polymerase